MLLVLIPAGKQLIEILFILEHFLVDIMSIGTSSLKRLGVIYSGLFCIRQRKQTGLLNIPV